MSEITLWVIAIVVFLIIEGVTAGIASIWFAIGALAALISALLGAKLWLQIVWFVVISAVTLVLTRPLAKKYVNGQRQPTNADRYIGAEGTVTERIDNIAGTGAVSVGGKFWTARSATGSIIETGTLVKAAGIEGVKLIVVPVDSREQRPTDIEEERE